IVPVERPIGNRVQDNETAQTKPEGPQQFAQQVTIQQPHPAQGNDRIRPRQPAVYFLSFVWDNMTKIVKQPAGTFCLCCRPSFALALSLVTIFLTSHLQAAPILADNFNYPDGAITNVSGTVWSEHSGGGSNEQVLITAGQAQLTFNRNEDVDATLTNSPYTPGGGAVLYSSFTVNFSTLPTPSGSYFAHFNASASFHALVWASTMGASGGSFRLGIGNTTAATATTGQLTNNLSLNSTYIVVT